MNLSVNIEKVAEAICNASSTRPYSEWVAEYGINSNTPCHYRKLAIAAIDADSRFPGGSREVRTLRWKLKTLGKQLGQAGERIHQLRTEIEYLRTGITVSPRDHYSSLERMRAAEAEVEKLRKQIKELENPPAAQDDSAIAGTVHEAEVWDDDA